MKPENYLPLDSAKKLIISALDQFNPALGVRAASVLYDDKRAHIVEVDKSKTNMMACRPSGITNDDLAALDMYMPDFAEKFGPHFTQQDNPTDHSIIDFEYDGSYRSVLWLGHELGHAIADDVQRENGHSFKNFSSAEMEEQAYFVQHIVSRYLRANVDLQHERSDDDLGENISSMSSDRATQFNNASRAFNAVQAKTLGAREFAIYNVLDQRMMYGMN